YITNFGKAHLAGFGSLQGVIQGKTELYTFCAKNNKTVFVNANDAEQIKQCKGIQKFTFGDNQQDATVQLLKAENTVLVSYKGEKIKSNLIGTYNFHNIAAAIAMGHYFKISAKDIKAAIEGYTPTNKRSQRIKKNGHHIVLDAYNANPTSMMAALQSFERAKGGNKTLFLGDMFELGKNAATEHQAIVDYLEKKQMGTTYLLGGIFFKTETNTNTIKKFETFESFKGEYKNETIPPSTILIKASRGMALERILELL
ncbi:MAG: Mur ligase family protein, partial [Marinirhabdus sp.]